MNRARHRNGERTEAACLGRFVGLSVPVLAAMLVAIPSGGCAPVWVCNFIEAENLARPFGKPTLVFYRDHLDPQSGRMMDVLESGDIRPLTSRMVRCSLVTAFDGNRRYIAQYGVGSAPALTIIHPDGTYHSREGAGTAEEIKQFLETAQPPGLRPLVNIQIPRRGDYLIRAEGIYEKAMAKAERQNRKVFIVYKWWLNPDATELIRRLMGPEVSARLTETVNCVLDWDYVLNRKHVRQYGVTKVPALIVVHQDGSSDILEGLVSTEEVVRFLTSALGHDRPRSRRTDRPRARNRNGSCPTKAQGKLALGFEPSCALGASPRETGTGRARLDKSNT